MKCKYFKTRSKKYKYYTYCTKLKKEVTFSQCRGCDKKEYKQYKTIKSRTKGQAKREKERFSIIYHDLTKCCVCGSKMSVEKNEIFEGAYRQTSIKYGMVAPMCSKETCHKRFHNDIKFNLYFKAMFQEEFIKTHSKEEFMFIFKQDYVYLYNKTRQ